MGLLWNDPDIQAFLEPVWLSVKVAAFAGFFVVILGTLAGRFMAVKRFKGKTAIETIMMLPLVLPPTVIGFFLIVLFGKNSFLGRAIEAVFRQPVIFTWYAAVMAAVVVAFPLMYQSAKAGFSSIDAGVEEAARVDGAGEWKVFTAVSVPLAAQTLLTGAVLAFARALGEFGATLMFAGNIPGVTQTLPTAIYVALESGKTALAWTWVIVIVAISFCMLYFVQRKRES